MRRGCHTFLDSGVSLAHTSAKSLAQSVIWLIVPAIDRQRESMSVPESDAVVSEGIIIGSGGDGSGCDSLQQVSPFRRSGTLDEDATLSSLKELVAAGDHILEPILDTIADAARLLTDASGAALAMWKDGAMVCRARSGETAPPIGAKLDAETGISGECLRTGAMQYCTDAEEDPRVDKEACRSRGLRSIAVLPIVGAIQGARETNGILVVFSTQPAAFSESHIAILQQLASLAERARATAEQEGASSATPTLLTANLPSDPEPDTVSKIDEQQPSSLLPASDRIRDVGLAFLGVRSRPLVWGAIGVVTILLLALAIWLGWRGPDETGRKARGVFPGAGRKAAVNAESVRPGGPHVPDNDPVWTANPGGESLILSVGKGSADSSVKLASQREMLAAKKSEAHRSSLSDGDGVSIIVADRVPVKQARPSAGSSSDETASAEPPALPEGSTSRPDVSELLSEQTSLPGISAVVSQGVSGGKVVHSVAPVYPAGARQFRLEGTVVLQATVMEDGTVGNIKVVAGAPVLAQSAVDAVKNWRYEPFQLDGNPVKNATTITIDFKFPGPGH